MAAGSERPDLLIGSGAGGSITYRGDNIYQSEPSEEQAEKATLAPQGSAAYEVLVQNDGQAPRRFVVAATESADAGWEISYKAGGVEITEEILGPSGYVTEEIAPGASEAISLVLSPAADAEPGSGAGSVVQVSLDADGSAPLDAVAATAALEGVATRAASRAVSQPDLLIKDLDEPTSAFAINGTYQTSPSGAQIETQAVSPGSKASYTVLIENDGSAAQSYVLRASESSETGWTVVYRQGLTDITAAIKGRGGFATAVLNPGSSTSIVVEITAGAGVFGGSSKSAFVRAFLSSTDTTVDDSVRAFAFVPIVDRVDLLIKDSFEPSSAFAINNVYQSSPSGDQIETQSVAAGGTATYNVLVQNDGNRRRSFVLKAAQSRASGWTVVYKSGATDITSQILSSTGFTTIALSPGFGTIITVQMTPATTVFGGSLRSSLIRAHFSTSETTVRDSVSAISSVPVIDRPDLLIKSAAQASTSFAIDNTYQTTPSGDQVETQFVTGGLTASYNVMLQNDGNRPRAYVLKAA